MRNRIVSFLGVCTILLFQCNSQNNVRHIILKNGLRVYLVQRDSPVTSAIFQVQGGKMTGPPQLASLTNRMLLQGNQIRNGYQIFREIETLGGRLGADESITTSFAYVTSPSVTFGDCFQIFCECLTMPTFDNSQAAITEFKKLKNQAIHFLFPSKSYKKDDDLLRNMLYDGSPIGKKAEDAGSVFSQDEMIAF